MGSHAFISHSQHDRRIAEQLCRSLEERGISCWMAPRDIPPGREWAQEIVKAIQSCRVLVLVFSKHACSSKHILRELLNADSCKKPVLPFRLEPADPDESFAYYLGLVQWFDAFPPPASAHFERFAKVLAAAMSEEAPSGHSRTRTQFAERAWNACRTHARAVMTAAVLLAAGAGVFAWINWSVSDAPLRLAVLSPDARRRVELNALREFNPETPPREGSQWTNTLGMRFIPLPGTRVLFCAFKTRTQDFERFVAETEYDASGGVTSMAADGWRKRGHSWRNPGPGFSEERPTEPVVGVSYNDALKFCEWLTDREREQGHLSASQFYRLPTDEEWSVAVGLPTEAGGTPSERNMRVKGIYPWGQAWPPPSNAGNYAGSEAWDDGNSTGSDPHIVGHRDGFRRTSPPGAFPPNRLGLFDVGGNAYEWVEDLFDPGSPNADLSKERTERGAAWHVANPEQIQSSFRWHAPPTSRWVTASFRCVIVVAPPEAPAMAPAPAGSTDKVEGSRSAGAS